MKSLKKVDLSSLSGESTSSAVTNIRNLISAINSMGNINVAGVQTFSTAIASIGKISMDGLVTSLQNSSAQVQSAITNLLNTVSASLNAGSAIIGVASTNLGRNIGTNIGTGLQSGVLNISSIVSVAISSIVASLNAQSSAFSSAGTSMGNGLVNGLTTSISAIPARISGTISGVATSVSGQTGAFRSAGSSLINALSSGFTGGSGNLKSAANSVMSSTLSAIRSKEASFRSAATSLMNRFVSGIRSATSSATGAVRSMMSSAVSATNGYYSSFYSAGANLARGFAAGISANSYMAAARARAMASAAASAARSALDINSPSRVMYKIGDFAGKGFVNALTEYVGESEKIGMNVADSAISGLRDTLSALSEAIDSDIDVTPTIRPVLDMSDVRSGIGTINSLSGLSPSLSVLADVRGINSSVNGRVQNGGNDDVVSELKRLRTGIKELPRNTYTVNGVTYDDGSAIGDAVSALVRAARIERRV